MYAQSLGKLLSHDGEHRVYPVEQPNSLLGGVVVMDECSFLHLSLEDMATERIVLVLHKTTNILDKVWDSGIRHVVFEGNSLEVAQLAVSAAELRLRTVLTERTVPQNC